MINNLELNIYKAVSTYSRMEGNFLDRVCAGIAKKDSSLPYTFNDLYSKDFPISESLYKNWINNNRESSELGEYAEELRIRYISWMEFDTYSKQDGNHWSILYSLTRPGVHENKAMIQITAHCPAGPPNYGSIFLLENQNSGWKVTHNFGLYNQ